MVQADIYFQFHQVRHFTPERRSSTHGWLIQLKHEKKEAAWSQTLNSWGWSIRQTFANYWNIRNLRRQRPRVYCESMTAWRILIQKLCGILFIRTKHLSSSIIFCMNIKNWKNNEVGIGSQEFLNLRQINLSTWDRFMKKLCSLHMYVTITRFRYSWDK